MNELLRRAWKKLLTSLKGGKYALSNNKSRKFPEG